MQTTSSRLDTLAKLAAVESAYHTATGRRARIEAAILKVSNSIGALASLHEHWRTAVEGQAAAADRQRELLAILDT